ncbi:MAG: T9SS type A sorting domain-containing protein [Bacteroidales bacterium]
MCINNLQAQVQYAGKPLSPGQYKLKEIPLLTPRCEIKTRSRPNDNSGIPPLKNVDNQLFCNLNIDYIDFGVWDTLGTGLKVWRAGIFVDNASSMALVFNSYKLNKGVRLFIYDKHHSQVFGAFTYNNNKPSGSLALSVVHSNTLYIEMQVMPFVSNPGELSLGYIACIPAIIKTTKATQDSFYRASDYCNKDINCYQDQNIQTVKNSVVRIIYDGVERCTGTLVNTTRQNGHPFLLTAGHCIDNQRRADNAVFYFQYESPSCNGPDGNSGFSVSGSTLLATTRNLDFALLELSEKPPFYYHPYFAGWDRQNIAPTSSYTIHHPLGDVKKISFENHPVITGDYSKEYLSSSHWLVPHWETGTTQKGSSGSPLFDQNNRVTGTLTGGWAVCGNPVDDYFQKLFHCWNHYSEPSGQLKFWLDPLQTGARFVDGYDPFRNFWSGGDTLSNTAYNNPSFLPEEETEWGYASGHNSGSANLFAENFFVAGQKNILGVMFKPGIVYPTSDSSKITVFVQKSIPDGEIMFETDVLLTDMAANEYFTIQPDEPFSVTGNFYIGYKIFYLPAGDTFALKLNIGGDLTENKASIFTDNTWQPLNEYMGVSQPVSFDICALIYDSVPYYPGPDTLPPEKDVFIYPNPAHNKTTITFWELPKYDIKINLYNVSGQLIKSELYNSPDVELEYYLDNLPSGMYFIRMNVNNFIIVKKILVLSEPK